MFLFFRRLYNKERSCQRVGVAKKKKKKCKISLYKANAKNMNEIIELLVNTFTHSSNRSTAYMKKGGVGVWLLSKR